MTETIRKSVSWLCKLSARNTRQVDQWNRIKDIDIDSHTYEDLIFDKEN